MDQEWAEVDLEWLEGWHTLGLTVDLTSLTEVVLTDQDLETLVRVGKTALVTLVGTGEVKNLRVVWTRDKSLGQEIRTEEARDLVLGALRVTGLALELVGESLTFLVCLMI
jgi:hypothetical protein